MAATSRAWCYDAEASYQLNKQFLSNTALTPVGGIEYFDFPGASVWVPTVNRMYVVDQLSWGLYTVDTTTGVLTFVATCTGVPLADFAGLCWDPSTNTMYGVATSIAQSQIMTVNITTGVCTPIGSPTAVCAGAISLSCPSNGSLFSIDIVNDNLYKWNKATGVATLVGPLGFDANYGQDAQFDHSDNVFYGAVFNLDFFQAELRTIDTLTGGTSLIGVYTPLQMATIAIRANPVCTPTSSSQSFTSCAPFSVTVGTNTYTTTGVYTDVLVNAEGCDSTVTTTLTVHALPTVGANSTSSAICAGNSVTLNGTGANTYTWTGSVTDNVAFTPAATDTYTVTGTDGNGCTGTATVSVTVNALPAVNANATSTTVCAGDQVTLTGSGATNYTWTGTVTDNVPFTPAATDTYTVTGTDGNGCSNTDEVTVTVNTLPAVTANTTAAVVCAGDQVTLTGSGATNYTWTGNVTDNVAFTPAATDTYTVTGTDGNGCSNTDEVTVTVNGLPAVTMVLPFDTACQTLTSVALSGESPAGGTWSGPGVTGNSFDPTAAGLGMVAIDYTYTDVNGCTASAQDSVWVDICMDITENNGTELMIYPNPTSGVFMINAAAGTTVEITDALGQVVKSFTATTSMTEVNITNMNSGVYFVRTINGDATTTTRVVKH
jgi:hypothetical protein